MYPDRPYCFAESTLATYCTRKSVYSPFIKIRGPAHKVNELDGCQNTRTRAALAVSMEKNEKISVSKVRLYTKSKKKSGWRLFIFAAATVAYSNRSVP